MAGWGDWVQLKTGEGSPVQVGDTTVTPISQALVLRTPPGLLAGTSALGRDRSGAAAAFVWNRPVAVLIERAGQVERRPVVDVTRILIWTILAASLLVRLRLAAARRNSRR